MKHFVAIVAVMAFLLTLSPIKAQSTDSLYFSRYYVVSHQVALLQWNALSAVQSYALYRHLPNQDGYTLCATVSDTHYLDTLHRVVCADTVGYYLQAYRATDTLVSDTVGLFFHDNRPTAPCSLRLATVDTSLHRILLSWYPSPDTDVMGYYICRGNPCRDFDTVWGRNNTSYLCHDTVDCFAEHNFRILAFDSCFQASPLTDYYHNPVLTLSAAPCSRTLHASWNRYVNMPDSVGAYRLWLRMIGEDSSYLQEVSLSSRDPLGYDLTVSDMLFGTVEAWLEVANTTDSLMAITPPQRFSFDRGDTAAYLRILSAVYDDAIPSVSLTFDVDSSFPGQEYHLLRATANDSLFQRIANLSSPAPYTDFDITRNALRYIYRLEVPDLCHQRATYSDTLGVALPPVGEITAWLPNVIIPQHPTCGLFCPYFLSPIAGGYLFEIFNRYGECLFHTDNIADCWDGTFRGQPLPQGTYVYRIRCRHADGSEKIYSGNITIVQ